MLLNIALFFFFALGIYLVLSYRVWQLKRGIVLAQDTPQKTVRQMIRELSQKSEYTLKTSLQFTVYFFTQVWILSSTEVKSWVFKAFPRLKTLLEEKDKLTGLYHGPASFFLANVSEYKDDMERSLKRRRGKEFGL